MYLPATPECRQQFHEYFAGGMGVSEAMKYHASLLELQDDTDGSMLMDASVNPKYSTVRWWYDQWRLHNAVPTTDSTVVEVNLLTLWYPFMSFCTDLAIR